MKSKAEWVEKNGSCCTCLKLLRDCKCDEVSEKIEVVRNFD